MHVFSIAVYAKTMLLTKTGFAVSLEQTTKKQRNDLGHQQNSFKKLIRDKKIKPTPAVGNKNAIFTLLN